MITIKPIPEQFKNADEATKNQLKELALVEALKTAISEEELKGLKAVIEILKFDVIDLGKRLAKKADKSELHTHTQSALEVKAEPKKEEPKEPSLLSELLKVIKNRKK